MKGNRKRFVTGILAFGVLATVSVAVVSAVLAPLPRAGEPDAYSIFSDDDHRWLAEQGWTGFQQTPWFCGVWTYQSFGCERRVLVFARKSGSESSSGDGTRFFFS